LGAGPFRGSSSGSNGVDVLGAEFAHNKT
jgi:hypothetical protein